MTPRYPGAVWLPTGGNGTMPNGPDACSLHEAVTRAQSVFGWIQTALACQAYNSQDGYFEQYMEWDDIAWGVKDGNSHVITIESFDGLLIDNSSGSYQEIGMGGIYGDSSNTGRWDDGQCERAADVAAWMHVNLGIALVESNRAGDPGFGPHRLGIEPWRSTIYGAGESWTNHDGKPCPGDLRIAQIPGIIARARIILAAEQAGTCTWLPTGAVDLPSALARTSSTLIPMPTPPPTEEDMPLDPIKDQAAFTAMMNSWIANYHVGVAWNAADKSPPLSIPDLLGQVSRETTANWQRMSALVASFNALSVATNWIKTKLAGGAK